MENNQQSEIFPGGVFFFDLDEDAQEIYSADAKRILVYGYDGVFKRGWSGHGISLGEIDNNPTPAYDTSGEVVSRVNAPLFEALACLYLSIAHGVIAGSSLVKVAPAKPFIGSGFRIIHTPVKSRGGAAGDWALASCRRVSAAMEAARAGRISNSLLFGQRQRCAA